MDSEKGEGFGSVFGEDDETAELGGCAAMPQGRGRHSGNGEPFHWMLAEARFRFS